jgi:hypothetical protein
VDRGWGVSDVAAASGAVTANFCGPEEACGNVVTTPSSCCKCIERLLPLAPAFMLKNATVLLPAFLGERRLV